jgi:hypothetical protein
MLEADLLPPVEATVRGIASAARALRLYPPTSPIPRQSVEAAKHYPMMKTQWVEFLGERPDDAIDRVERIDVRAA